MFLKVETLCQITATRGVEQAAAWCIHKVESKRSPPAIVHSLPDCETYYPAKLTSLFLPNNLFLSSETYFETLPNKNAEKHS